MATKDYVRVLGELERTQRGMIRSAVARLNDPATSLGMRSAIALHFHDKARWPVLLWCMENITFRGEMTDSRDWRDRYPAVSVLISSRLYVIDLLPAWLKGGPRSVDELRMMGFVVRTVSGSSARAEALVAATLVGESLSEVSESNRAKFVEEVRGAWVPPE